MNTKTLLLACTLIPAFALPAVAVLAPANLSSADDGNLIVLAQAPAQKKAPPKAAPKAAPKAVPKAAPKPAPKAVPKAAPKPAPKAVPKAVPKAAPKAVPKAAPKVVPQPAPKAAPKAVPKVAPQPAPKALPKAAPPPAPKALPKAAPKGAMPAPAIAQPTVRPRRLDEVRSERRLEQSGNRTIIRESNRTIIREPGRTTIIRRDESERFRRFGDARFERRGNENFTIINRPGGYQIVTITDAEGRLLRRVRRGPDGREFIIIDNRPRVPGLGFFVVLPPPVIRIPRERYIVAYEAAPPALIYDTLIAPPIERIERPYSLDEIRYSPLVRDRMPRIDIDSITFDSGSWEITPDQIRSLQVIADGIRRAVEANPQEVFLIEGHTDAVGAEEDNLSLSDRRAEAVAEALTTQFGIPPENLTSQGYGEQQPKIPTAGPLRENRRVTVRRITPLLTGQGQPQQ